MASQTSTAGPDDRLNRSLKALQEKSAVRKARKPSGKRAEVQQELLSPEQAPAPSPAAERVETPASGEAEARPKRKTKPKVEKAGRRKADMPGTQGDFFTPVLYDVGAKDSRGVMDVAVFRLSKKDKRENAMIRYELPDGHVVVTSGPHGMASVWDYDIVLMAVSHLTEAMNRYQNGKGDKPSQIFKPHIGDVLKFCRKDNGGNQKDAVVGALERLSTTFVGIERTVQVRGKVVTVNEGENLIGPFKTVSNSKKKVEYIEIKIADWMYNEITQGSRPDVLTVHPDYFLRESGIARFIYRLARKAAGRGTAAWGFKTLFDRSGSTGTFKEFTRAVRELVKVNDLPEYALVEEPGKDGPVLHMVHRAIADQWKEGEPPAEDKRPGESEDSAEETSAKS